MLKEENVVKLIKGFYVVAYQMRGSPALEAVGELNPLNYDAVGGRLPLAEFPYPADVFERFRDTSIEQIPRPIKRHDIINIHKGPEEVYSLLVVSNRYDKYLWRADTKVFETTIPDVRLMSLSEPIIIKWK